MFVIKRKMFHIISQFCESLSTFVIKRKMFSYRACMVTSARARANGSVYFCPSITNIKNSRLFKMTVGGG